MQGTYTKKIAEKLTKDGKTKLAFQLKAKYNSYCTLEFEDKVVLVQGGKDVHEYNINGWVKDLPRLNVNHGVPACGHYVDNNNNMVILT